MSTYCMFKGALKYGVPYLNGYHGNPHYAVVAQDANGDEFVVLANVKSDSTIPGAGEAGYHVLYSWDQYFSHPLTQDLRDLKPGLYQEGFPKLDYSHDAKLLDLSKMRPIALDTATQQNDINGLLDDMLALNRNVEPVEYIYKGQKGPDKRMAWQSTAEVTVYGFGFLFEPQHDGLHETHMNQGNPKPKPGSGLKDHSSENGTYQDGALIVQIGDKFQALFIAFQTQLVPTDNRGFPTPSAKRILD
ncbi:YukJ family protein [Rugamonas sp. A1-17]|nr:YukJ family protein [Rugamonas sp. A1-17]